MIIRNSLNSIFRTRKKTVLFFILIFLLSIFLGMGVSVWAANQSMIKECNENYQTIGVFTYMGTAYPDETVLTEEVSQNLLGTEQLMKDPEGAWLPEVISFAPAGRCLGLAGEYQPVNATPPYADEAIYLVKNVYETSVFQSGDPKSCEYMSEVSQRIYSYKKNSRLLVHFSLENRLGDAFEPDYQKQYLIYGKWYGDAFSVYELEEMENADFLQEEDNYYVKKARYYEGVNRLISVELVNQPEYAKVFHQGQAKLKEGEFYDAAAGEKVCMITSDIAGSLKLKTGDLLPLALIPVEPGTIYDSYDPDREYPKDAYRITGIIEATAVYKNSVYIPLQEEISSTYGYGAGQVRLENGSGDTFLSEVEGRLPDRMVLDIYDQGYTQVMAAMKSLQQTTLIILVICIAASITVLILFGYLFVFRQRETVVIMKNLGTEKRKIYGYLIISSGVLAAAASFAGAAAGFGVSSYFLGVVMDFLNTGIGSGIDSRYSYLAEGLVKDYSYDIRVPVWYFLLTACCLTMAAMLVCLVFAAESIRPPKVKKKKKGYAPRREHRSSAQNGVILRYALLSIRRGGMRTWIVCLVSGVLMLVFCVLSYTGNTYEKDKEQLTAETKIQGYFTNLTGDRISSLMIDNDAVRMLEDSGYIEDVRKTFYRESFHYFYLGIPEYADGTAQEVPPLVIPDMSEAPYAWEKFLNQIVTRPCMLSTNDLSAVGEFFYSSHPRVEWMEDYDASVFAKAYEMGKDEIPCVISDHMQQEQGIAMGDVIRIEILTIYHGRITGECIYDFRVCGLYGSEGGKDHILVPYAVGDDWTFVRFGQERNADYDTVRFTLKDASALSEFKDELQEMGFGQLRERNTISSAVILKDTAYQKTIRQIDGKIRYMNLLYPVLYVLTGLISFLVSYLLMHNRKGELALMQSMGTPGWKIFMAFFLEQAVLSITGIAAVWLIWSIAAGFLKIQALCMAVCICCYMAGCGLSVGILNRNRVLELLREKD